MDIHYDVMVNFQFLLIRFFLILQINMHNALVLTVSKYKFENAMILRYDTHYDFINPYNYNYYYNPDMRFIEIII